MTGSRVLIFVEDPGAALFMRGLPQALRDSGGSPSVLALPHAAPYFAGEDLLPVPDRLDLAAAHALMEALQPTALVTGTAENTDTFAFALIDAAREREIPSLGAVDSAPNAEYRFRGTSSYPLRFAPDALLLPDAATAYAYRALGFPDSGIAVCGHPRLDEIATLRTGWDDSERQRQRIRHFPGVAQDRKVIVFVSELSVGLGDNRFRRNDAYRLSGTSTSDKRSEIVIEELLIAARALPGNPHMVLRLHPKQRLEEEAHSAGLFDQVSHAEPGLEVANAADLVVGMTSILLVEAATLGRPVLSIVPMPEERDWLGDPGRAIPCLWTREAIAEWLQQAEWPAAEAAPGHSGANARMAQRILSACAGGAR